jgi:hypothetical protein
MSSAGFQPAPVDELKQLRDAYKALNDISRNLASAEKCVKKQDPKMAEHHLRAAQWHTQQAKKAIETIGQAKRP